MPGNPISPEDQRDFNRRLIATLEELGVVYAIGGSVAAMMYSEPRLTRCRCDDRCPVKPAESAGEENPKLAGLYFAL